MIYRRLLLVVILLLVVSSALFAQDEDFRANAGPISYGQTISVQLGEALPLVSYLFSATDGDVVSITSISPDNSLDTYLRLLNSEGEVLADNDDSEGDRNSRIIGFEIPADGAYVIVVTSYVYFRTGQIRAGSVEVSLSAENVEEVTPEATETFPPTATPEPIETPEPTTTPEPTVASQPDEDKSASLNIEATEDIVEIDYGTIVEGTLTESIPAQYFQFSAEDGDRVTISLVGDFDTLLLLQNETGRELEADDDGGVERSSLILDFIVSETANYIIVASSYEFIRQDTPIGGSYTLELGGETAPVLEVIEPEAVALEYGDSVTGELTISTPYALYTFEAASGDIVTITVDSEFDSILLMEDTDGNQLAFDDDSGTDRSAQVESLEIATDGTVVVRVDSYRNYRGQGATEGAFSLSLTEGGAAVVEETDEQQPEETPIADESDTIPIAYGDTVTGELTEEMLNLKYRFSASAGDVVTIDLSGFDTFMFVYDREGNELGRDDDSGENGGSRLENLAIPADGDYIIQADSYGNQRLNDPTRGGVFTLTLTLVEQGAVIEDDAAQETEIPAATAEPEATSTPEPTREPQEVGETPVIASGESISGDLTEAAPSQQVRFSGNTGDAVTIDLQADFDTYLILLDPDGEIIAEDDDGGDDRNSRIEAFTLPQDGDYTIVATSYNNAQLDEPVAGAYTLSLMIGEITGLTPRALEPEPITYGDPVSGNLVLDAPFRQYVFGATAGDVVSILLEADFDGFLYLFNADGNELTLNDDGGGDLNSLIDDFEIPADGDYIIQVDSYGNAQLGDPRAGSYTLTLTLDSDEVVDDDTQVEGELLQIGDTINSEFTSDSPNRVYQFSASAGDVVVIGLQSDIDTYLYVLDADGNVVSEDDDSGDGFNAQITFEAPADGTYTIIADTYSNAQADQPTFGEFSLTLSEGTQPDAVTDQAADLMIGDVVLGSLSAREPEQSWTFNASEGDLIVIFMVSEDFDAYLTLYDEFGVEVNADDDSAGNLNSRIGPFMIPADGKYTIVASSYSYQSGGSAETGQYSLSFDTAVIDVVEYGETVTRQFDVGTPILVYQFSGRAGDLIGVDLETSSYSARLTLENENGDFVDATYNDFEDLGPTLLPEDGVYLLTVNSEDTTDSADFSLRIFRVETQAVALDTDVSVALEGEMQTFSFEGNENDIITITVNSDGGIDTTLRLLDPDGYLLDEDFDGGPGLDPELYRIILPASGTYTVGILPVVSGSSGNLTLNISRESAPSLDAGPQTIHLTSSVNQGSASFSAEAGETVYLSVRVAGGNAQSTTVTVSQDGRQVASNTLGNVQRVIIELTVPADGELVVIAQNPDYLPVILELELVDLGE